jgi:hypothetical protein
MPYNSNSLLWSGREEHFFPNKDFQIIQQKGPHCVSTVLGIMTNTDPKIFQGLINTQDPVSWSDALKEYNMKLAYCPTDVRRIKHYLKEMISLDDLFTLSYYSSEEPDIILGEPDGKGWITGSHIVILHRDKIWDSKTGSITNALDHECKEKYAIRIFRVVHASHPRGL